MTRIGLIWTIALMALAAFGVAAGAMKQRGTGATSGSPRASAPTRSGMMPAVAAEPVAWRSGETRFVECRAEKDLRQDPGILIGRGDLEYVRSELAAVLAEQALAAGAVRFSREGDVIKAELRAKL